MFIIVNSITIKIHSKAFHASFELWQLQGYSVNPNWQQSDLRLTRITDPRRGEVTACIAGREEGGFTVGLILRGYCFCFGDLLTRRIPGNPRVTAASSPQLRISDPLPSAGTVPAENAGSLPCYSLSLGLPSS